MKRIIIIISLIIIALLAGVIAIHSITNIVNKEYITGGFYSLKGLIKQLKQGTN